MEEVLNGKPLTFSIVVPVFREDAVINDVIAQLRRLEPGEREQPEIIVVDGDPAGQTLKAISQGDVTRLTAPLGRGSQMNSGAAVAGGDILLFLHADTELPRDALRLIGRAMYDQRFVAGAFDLGIRSGRCVFRAVERAASLRSRLTRVPFGDQAIFLRRDYFARIGGYRELPLMEDVEIMQRIRKRGDRIVILRQRVLTSSRRWDREGVLRCTLRNWLLQLLFFAGVSPGRFAKLYRVQ